jgi:hypothetical protein
MELNTGTSDIRTMNSYIRIVATQCSLEIWFFLRNISADTLHKGDTEDDDDDDDKQPYWTLYTYLGKC